MKRAVSGYAALSLLLCQSAGAQEVPGDSWHAWVRLEVGALARVTGGQGSGYARLAPALVLDGGEDWGLHLGAPVLLQPWGRQAQGGWVRQEDWDSLSDWGQWVQALQLGGDSAPVGLWVGALEDYSLLSGHLVRRYSNRTHPDYHPAGAFLTATLGPVYTEAFTSDVLAARLVGLQAEVDLAHVLGKPADVPGGATLGLSVVHEAGQARGPLARVTHAHVDGRVVLMARPDFELHLLAGLGGQAGQAGAWGAVVGVGADAVSATLDMRLRLEARRQQGGFRQGFFGPDYEWARGLAQAAFPPGFSAYGEAGVDWDEERLEGLLSHHLHLSVGVEVFSWGRVDVDGRVAVQLFERSLEVAVSGWALGLRQPGSHHVYSGQVRWRLTPWLYVLAQGGITPAGPARGAPQAGAFASLSVGGEHAR
jgi:hypothetical protein